MTPRAIAKQRTISTGNLSISGDLSIQENLLIPDKTQQPMKIVKTNSLHTVSVPPAGFNKRQLKKKKVHSPKPRHGKLGLCRVNSTELPT
jgi:hypothetical protein